MQVKPKDSLSLLSLAISSLFAVTVLSANRTADDAGRARCGVEICVAHYCKTLCKGSLSPFESNVSPYYPMLIWNAEKRFFNYVPLLWKGVNEGKFIFLQQFIYNKKQRD